MQLAKNRLCHRHPETLALCHSTNTAHVVAVADMVEDGVGEEAAALGEAGGRGRIR